MMLLLAGGKDPLQLERSTLRALTIGARNQGGAEGGGHYLWFLYIHSIKGSRKKVIF